MTDFTGTAAIQHNLIMKNYYGVALGAPLKVVFEDNTVTQNKQGISVAGYSDQSVFSNNNIYGNTNQSICLASRTVWDTNMNVSNNWWGTKDSVAIAHSIVDSHVNSTLGTVTFTPFLQSENPDAPKP